MRQIRPLFCFKLIDALFGGILRPLCLSIKRGKQPIYSGQSIIELLLVKLYRRRSKLGYNFCIRFGISNRSVPKSGEVHYLIELLRHQSDPSGRQGTLIDVCVSRAPFTRECYCISPCQIQPYPRIQPRSKEL